jgi:predicted ATPase
LDKKGAKLSHVLLSIELEALVYQLEALTKRGPVLMILEDAHWIDPTSLEAFGRIIDRLRSIHLLRS